MEWLILLFGIAGFVWLIPAMETGRLSLVAMATLGVGVVFGPDFFHLDGPIQLSLDRVMWLGLFALAAIAWRRGQARVPTLTRVDFLMVCFVIWTLFSAISVSPPATGTPPAARWLFYVLMPASMYAVARLIEIRALDIHWLLGGSIVLGVYLAATAICEICGLHNLVFPRFITDPQQWQFYGRGRGPLMNPSGNGIVISLALVAAALGVIYSGRRGKLVYGVTVLLLLGGIYATLTRSAWLGGLSALALVAFLHSPRWQRVLVLATVLLIGAASMSGLRDQFVRLKRDKNLTAEDAERSMKLRPLLAVVAWEMFKDKPIAGHGYGHYFGHNDRFHAESHYDLPLDQARTYAQHNVFLSLLVDTGLVGLTLFVGWMLSLCGIGWQLARQRHPQPETRWTGMLLLGLLLSYFCNGMFQDVMIIPMIHMCLFFVAGVAVTVFQGGLLEGKQGYRIARTVIPTHSALDPA